MPYRKTPLVNGEIYHIFNRSVARQPIFPSDTYYQRGFEVLSYYNNLNPPVRFSHFSRLPIALKNEIIENLNKEDQKLVQILAFCFMPNHVHFLIKEIRDHGITKFMRIFQNSYAKYFNTRTERTGSLFQSMFKAVRILTDEQLLHVARYIHLNPVTAFILKDIEELSNYQWSSYPIYIGKQTSNIISTDEILSFFATKDKFIEFTKDQIDYQRKLDRIKHLLLE
ncbi:transposase [Candidatus Daviesbacteria bacterium]|nr:transposase [Candidatus Daviesbacteria bacterium]